MASFIISIYKSRFKCYSNKHSGQVNRRECRIHIKEYCKMFIYVISLFIYISCSPPPPPLRAWLTYFFNWSLEARFAIGDSHYSSKCYDSGLRTPSIIHKALFCLLPRFEAWAATPFAFRKSVSGSLLFNTT